MNLQFQLPVTFSRERIISGSIIRRKSTSMEDVSVKKDRSTRWPHFKITWKIHHTLVTVDMVTAVYMCVCVLQLLAVNWHCWVFGNAIYIVCEIRFIAKYITTVAMVDISTLAMYQNFSSYNSLQELTCIAFMLHIKTKTFSRVKTLR